MAHIDDYKAAAKGVFDLAKANVGARIGQKDEAAALQLVGEYNDKYIKSLNDDATVIVPFDKWVDTNQDAANLIKTFDPSVRDEAVKKAKTHFSSNEDFVKARGDLQADGTVLVEKAKDFFGSNMGGILAAVAAAFGLPMILNMFGMGGGEGAAPNPIMSILTAGLAFLVVGAVTNKDSVGGGILKMFTGGNDKDKAGDGPAQAKDAAPAQAQDQAKTAPAPAQTQATAPIVDPKAQEAAKAKAALEKATGEADLAQGNTKVKVIPMDDNGNVTLVISSARNENIARTFTGVLNSSGALTINKIVEVPAEGKDPVAVDLKTPVTIPGIGNIAKATTVNEEELANPAKKAQLDNLVKTLQKDDQQTEVGALTAPIIPGSINFNAAKKPAEPARQ